MRMRLSVRFSMRRGGRRLLPHICVMCWVF